MNGEWKPGDVVSAHVRTRGRRHVLVFDPKSHEEHPWLILDCDLNGTSRVSSDEDSPNITKARLLVVIDPEDRKQVERFVEHLRPLANDGTVSGVQQALREFANPTPPKPAEPIGLGAVVEDAEDGSIWSRRSDGRWHCLTGDPNVEDLVEWRHFATARVLSEGVTA